ncbi:hypothetical protein D9V37_10475 [Nocardioides mangrovicus]|uniref:DUF2742 domain-containing protein n=1 Tax=Nocardioides mangrovicus TaxID=2478913 RepID=A0A3L8P0M8_9ACTN|nr:hypothetical protein [Nocardioides mangrovicus]RLV49000.1 hypothetical protein D9V37_10475 [Nocardioides mangrovicus]
MSPDVETRRRWAARMLARCTVPAPTYGSREFNSLPDGDVRRVAAVVRAAEAWARCGDELVESLHAELELAREAHKRAEDAEYLARAAEHRDSWRHLGVVRGQAFADTEEFISGRQNPDQGRPA